MAIFDLSPRSCSESQSMERISILRVKHDRCTDSGYRDIYNVRYNKMKNKRGN